MPPAKTTPIARSGKAKRRASLHTLGCRLNQAETTLLEEKLVAAGYEIVPFGAPADLGIINTCTVTNEADAKSRKLIRQFIRKNPEAITIVIGCYAQMDAKTLAEVKGVDLIVGNQEKLNVLDYVGEGKNTTPLVIRDQLLREDFSVNFTREASSIVRRANLKIQEGCDFMCSYCIIPFARGRSRSRELDNLLDEARELAARGARELVLTGVNLGCYDFAGKNIVDVVDRLNDIDGLARIRISSIEPTTIPEALFPRMASPGHKLAPHLHIPLQSGSDCTLEAMKRSYTRQEFLDFVRLAQDRVPGIGIGSDILVGFPGETEEDFEQTLALVEESPLFYAHVFKYSERRGTASCRIKEKVDPRTAQDRSIRLRQCAARKTEVFLKQHIGEVVDVIFEDEHDGRWGGYTGNYVRVAMESSQHLTNKLRKVHITQARRDFVLGELMADTPSSTAG